MERGYTQAVKSLVVEDFLPLVDLAWAEDMPEGDITTESLFHQGETAEATLLAKDSGVLCGTQVILALLKKAGGQVSYEAWKEDGAILSPGMEIGKLSGSLQLILKMERTLLNFIQYLSGIATNAHKVVKQYPNLIILDTRKTLPAYRKLAKYAVYTGGAWNHRLNLSDMAMLKDNHIAKAGSIGEAVRLVREKYPDKKIELEIDGLAQLKDALEADPDIILLDNFSIEDTKVAVETIRKQKPSIFIECSGGITPEKLQELSSLNQIGVSMGYLTHTVKFLDISLEIH
ncbi:nicotinate-nucleotide pyrophosphorylase [Leptospira ryugenii]|uniref:Probable nicotinate-nucleotide pyrophosphorylase [carboxylating] n=1 Tax=Leptospira ryugenii TaxID=1917863 RepID=A0A2P2DYK7_9LEPT|nr:carboxylating nicotinate-nucleotide diphosphorylase [Leptospira ryugenii]GBF49728.1 nicotinate-nucleotide pyrophosphorylase [Leptospira ryugenii]